MAGRPKYTKSDLNQQEIVEGLRSLGFDVDDVHNLKGLYDIVVSGERHVPNARQCHYTIECSVRVEIKSEGGEFTQGELDYMRSQCARNSYIAAYSIKDILNWFDGIAPS